MKSKAFYFLFIFYYFTKFKRLVTSPGNIVVLLKINIKIKLHKYFLFLLFLAHNPLTPPERLVTSIIVVVSCNKFMQP